MILPALTSTWQRVAGPINQLALRERLLVCLSSFALIYLMSDFIFIQPYTEKKNELDLRYKQAEQKLEQASAQEIVFTRAIENSPKKLKQRELEALTGQVKALDEKLNSLASGIVPAVKLPSLMRDVLTAKRDLQLEGLKAGLPSSIQIASSSFANGSDKGSVAVEPERRNSSENRRQNAPEPSVVQKPPHQKIDLYRHGVTLEFKGGFYSILEYLVALEELEWNFFWDSMEYEVDSYPTGRVRLEVYTLSMNKDLWGV